MKKTYEPPITTQIECRYECLNSYSGIKDMQDTGVFIEILDGD